MSSDPASSYDRVPYGLRAFAATHPDRLAVMARLVGLDPAPVERCRVLDLGCATGGNIMSMAVGLPESQFVGVDISPRQIAQGQEATADLGLSNVTLMARDIMEIGEELGRFDYIVCHGVFTWVPPAVQKQILGLCRGLLNPNGIAYISYNTYPGWRFRGILRDAMLFHTAGMDDPTQRVGQSLALLEFLSKGFPHPSLLAPKLLTYEIEELLKSEGWYVFHEYLESINQPLYFHEFMALARRHGLNFLGEAVPSPLEARIKPEVRAQIAALSRDPVDREQYVDFLTFRIFRRSLLCHREARPTGRTLMQTLNDLRVAASPRWPAEQADMASDEAVSFEFADGTKVETNHPVSKSALAIVGAAWPRSIPFPELCARVGQELRNQGKSTTAIVEALAPALLQWFGWDLIELHTWEPPFVLEAGEKPLASPIARQWARIENQDVVNLCHTMLKVVEFPRMLLPLLDGKRDRAALLRHFTRLARGGAFSIDRDGKPVEDPVLLADVLREYLDRGLASLARNAYLLA